nr:colicin transporter [Paraburkholderia guartelaensis]
MRPPAGGAGHFAINGRALNPGGVRISPMFRCPQKTLTTSRFSPDLPLARFRTPHGVTRRFPALGAICAVALSLGASVPALAQAVGVTGPLQQQGAPTVPVQPAALGNAQLAASEAAGVAGTSPSQQSDFDARQQVLDRRTAENDYQFAVAQHNCYSTFFVNHCIGKARDKMRVVQADIRREQLALDDEKRAAHAQQRDQQAALQRAQDEANAPQRAANEAASAQAYEQKQQQHALDQAQRQAEAPQRAANEQAYEEKQRQHALAQAQRQGEQSQRNANQAAYDQKQANYQNQLDEARRQGEQKAQERADKAERYQQKQEDAAKHKADVEERQKQAAEKAQQKQQQEEQQKQQEKQQQEEQQDQ